MHNKVTTAMTIDDRHGRSRALYHIQCRPVERDERRNVKRRHRPVERRIAANFP
jgi:hypothetical protein